MATKPERYVFVSYARENKALRDWLIEVLDRMGVASWSDDALRLGDVWAEVVAARIGDERCAVVLLIWTCESAGSEQCRDECLAAMLEHQKLVLPLLFDGHERPGKVNVKLAGLEYVDFHSQLVADALRRLHRLLYDKRIATKPDFDPGTARPMPPLVDGETASVPPDGGAGPEPESESDETAAPPGEDVAASPDLHKLIGWNRPVGDRFFLLKAGEWQAPEALAQAEGALRRGISFDTLRRVVVTGVAAACGTPSERRAFESAAMCATVLAYSPALAEGVDPDVARGVPSAQAVVDRLARDPRRSDVRSDVAGPLDSEDFVAAEREMAQLVARLGGRNARTGYGDPVRIAYGYGFARRYGGVWDLETLANQLPAIREGEYCSPLFGHAYLARHARFREVLELPPEWAGWRHHKLGEPARRIVTECALAVLRSGLRVDALADAMDECALAIARLETVAGGVGSGAAWRGQLAALFGDLASEVEAAVATPWSVDRALELVCRAVPLLLDEQGQIRGRVERVAAFTHAVTRARHEVGMNRLDAALAELARVEAELGPLPAEALALRCEVLIRQLDFGKVGVLPAAREALARLEQTSPDRPEVPRLRAELARSAHTSPLDGLRCGERPPSPAVSDEAGPVDPGALADAVRRMRDTPGLDAERCLLSAAIAHARTLFARDPTAAGRAVGEVAEEFRHVDGLALLPVTIGRMLGARGEDPIDIMRFVAAATAGQPAGRQVLEVVDPTPRKSEQELLAVGRRTEEEQVLARLAEYERAITSERGKYND